MSFKIVLTVPFSVLTITTITVMSIHGFDEPTMNTDETSQTVEIWDSDDDSISEIKKIERVHNKAGYLEGISQTKDNYLQQGFDNGYPIGAKIGQQVGKIIGGFQSIGLIDLEKAAKNELSPDQLFSENYYTIDGEEIFNGGIHPLIKKWEKILGDMKVGERASAVK